MLVVLIRFIFQRYKKARLPIIMISVVVRLGSIGANRRSTVLDLITMINHRVIKNDNL